ncbi:hypothetical protein KIN20_019446 [Parelaphostrongylus tenuis]|uniref:Uncharacterized protein n=1 Tax=Parelaphostrongylus tenuis TaxID=148309 RepID=A0AAD5N4V3_PARTN|nr:hypothetical protein KIN20_019446 [Parelaphostrongylus tenuis]
MGADRGKVQRILPWRNTFPTNDLHYELERVAQLESSSTDLLPRYHSVLSLKARQTWLHTSLFQQQLGGKTD